MHVLFSTGNAPGLGTGYGGQALLLLRAILSKSTNTCTVLTWNFSVHGPRALHPLATPDFIKLAPSMQRVLHQLSAEERRAWIKRVTWTGNPYASFPVPIERGVINAAIVNCKADVFCTLQDVFMFQPGPFACSSVAYIPLHFLPIEKATARVLSDFDAIVAISHYGEALLRDLFCSSETKSIKHIETIPHGRDSRVFCPLPHAQSSADVDVAKTRAAKIALRRELGWPTVARTAQTQTAALSSDAWERAPGGDGIVFVVLLIASNSEESGRKAFDAQIAAFVEFARKREAAGFPRDATFLVIHAEAVRAYDLGKLLETFGEFPERPEQLADRRGTTCVDAQQALRGERFLVSPANTLGASHDETVAKMMRAADVLLAASASEGCGVPILEAQLCGTPVVTNATTAMPEQTLLGVSAAPAQYIARMDFGSGWFLPSVTRVAQALWTISQWGDAERARRVAATLPLVKQRFDAPIVQAQWAHFFERWERDVVHSVLHSTEHSEHCAERSVDDGMDLQFPQLQCLPPTSSGKFKAWLDAGAQNFSIALTDERKMCLAATRALFLYEQNAQAKRKKEHETRRIRQSISERLEFVRASIQAYRTARSCARVRAK